MARRRGRWMFRALTALVSVIALIVIAGLPLYVFPTSDEPRKVDVVYVIGPATPSRLELARHLIVDEGISDTLLISVPEYGVRSAHRWSKCVKDPIKFDVLCEHSEPFTTQGEAQTLARLAREHGWESAAVITFTPHVTRTRLIMERCFPGDELDVIVDPAPLRPEDWVWHYVYQTGAFIKALTVATDC
ncbi:YdcF family protein [Diaminobutyricimonas aerilata]|nr:YdcF family protein [Diaminobutyricimonas aerilata]